MTRIHIICVVNKFEVYNTVIRDCAYMSQFAIQIYDNTAVNIGIAERYNDFLGSLSDEDAWLIFCHQDFCFLEDVSSKLEKLDTKFIYGPIGARYKKCLSIRNLKIQFKKRIFLGQINQSRNDQRFFKNGEFIKSPSVVDTIDCCCMIVHSSLFKKYNLQFDEKFKFHLYAEDFSLNAFYKHGIKTKAVQLECKHLSLGNTSPDYFDSLAYLQSKYKGKKFAGTCF